MSDFVRARSLCMGDMGDYHAVTELPKYSTYRDSEDYEEGCARFCSVYYKYARWIASPAFLFLFFMQQSVVNVCESWGVRETKFMRFTYNDSPIYLQCVMKLLAISLFFAFCKCLLCLLLLSFMDLLYDFRTSIVKCCKYCNWTILFNVLLVNCS